MKFAFVLTLLLLAAPTLAFADPNHDSGDANDAKALCFQAGYGNLQAKKSDAVAKKAVLEQRGEDVGVLFLSLCAGAETFAPNDYNGTEVLVTDMVYLIQDFNATYDLLVGAAPQQGKIDEATAKFTQAESDRINRFWDTATHKFEEAKTLTQQANTMYSTLVSEYSAAANKAAGAEAATQSLGETWCGW